MHGSHVKGTKLTAEQIARDLPEWPVEIVENWLVPETEEKEWPPTSDNEWRYLTKGQGLGELRSFRWEQAGLELSPASLTHESLILVVELFRGTFGGKPVFWVKPSDRTRIEFHIQHLEKHGAFPWPPVLQRFGNRYDILDGCHRLVAYFMLSCYFPGFDDGRFRFVNFTQPFWIGAR